MRRLDMKQTKATAAITNNNNNRDEKVTGILPISNLAKKKDLFSKIISFLLRILLAIKR